MPALSRTAKTIALVVFCLAAVVAVAVLGPTAFLFALDLIGRYSR